MGRPKNSVDDCDRDCFHCKLPDCMKNGNFRDANGLGPPAAMEFDGPYRWCETIDSLRQKYRFEIGESVRVAVDMRDLEWEHDRRRNLQAWRDGVVVGIYPFHIEVRVRGKHRGFQKELGEWNVSVSFAAMASERVISRTGRIHKI